jgi:hypothetical protein
MARRLRRKQSSKAVHSLRLRQSPVRRVLKGLRCTRSVPDCLRGIVWQQLSGSRVLVLQNGGVYEQLVLQPSAAEADITRDIGRTFPAHVAYQQRHGAGQRSLYNVLKAYAVREASLRTQRVPPPAYAHVAYQQRRGSLTHGCGA